MCFKVGGTRISEAEQQHVGRLVGKPGPGRACLRCKPTAGVEVATKQTLPDRDSGSARIREGD